MHGCRLRQCMLGVTPEAKIQRGLLEKSIIYIYDKSWKRKDLERMYGNMENILYTKVVR